MQRMRWLIITLVSTVLSFMPSMAGAVSKHGSVRTTTAVLAASLRSVVGFLAQLVLPVSEPAGLIIIGLLLIGISVLVRKAVPGKRGR